MGARRDYFKDGEALVLPITDGAYATDLNYQRMTYGTNIVYIAAYDSNDELVTPTSGTGAMEFAGIDGQFLTPSSGDSVIEFTDLINGSATYTVPVAIGGIIQARITLDGVSGNVSYIKAFMWRQ